MRTLRIDGVPAWSKIGLGTWQFGSREWGYGPEYADREAGAIVRRALDLGVTLVDSAEMYGFGRSERILGAALDGHRDEAFLATKIFPVAPVAPVVVQRAEASARRLGVDRIDLYQLHWPNPVVPVAATMRGLRELVDRGLVAEVGVSNFGLAGWQAAERALGGRVLSNQVQYSLAARGPEFDLIPWAERTGHVIIAYSPLAQGLLSGRYGPSNPPPPGVRSANPLFLPENLERAAPLLETLRQVADAHDATPAQIALAWTIRSQHVVAIPGASSVAQLESNAAAAELALTDTEAEALTDAARDFVPVRGAAAARGTVERLLARARR